MMEFIRRFLGRPSSSATAKERLRLVLLSDHLSLAPDVVEALKNDLIEVISRYCDVDAAHCDVTFEQQDARIAMLANIPILGMRSRPKPPAVSRPAAVAEPIPVPAAAPAAAAQPSPAPLAADGAPVTHEEPAASQPAAPRKRKRRRASNAAGSNGATTVPSGAGLSSV